MQFDMFRNKTFSELLSIIFLNPKILGFLFSTKNSLTLKVYRETENLGSLLDKLRKLCLNGTVI